MGEGEEASSRIGVAEEGEIMGQALQSIKQAKAM